MDSITLILSALASSKFTSTQTADNEKIRDLYNELKTLLQHKFEGRQEALFVLTKYEARPDVWKVPLQEELEQAHADQDPKIIETAQSLMTLVSPQQEAAEELLKRIRREVERNYEQALTQSKRAAGISRRVVLISAIGTILAGIIIVILLPILARSTNKIPSNLISWIIATLSVFVPLILSFIYNRFKNANKQIDDSFKKLLEVNRFDQALELVMITEDAEDRAHLLEALLKRMTDVSAKDRGTTVSTSQQ